LSRCVINRAPLDIIHYELENPFRLAAHFEHPACKTDSFLPSCIFHLRGCANVQLRSQEVVLLDASGGGHLASGAEAVVVQ
jgi:hypothetical protein